MFKFSQLFDFRNIKYLIASISTPAERCSDGDSILRHRPIFRVSIRMIGNTVGLNCLLMSPIPPPPRLENVMLNESVWLFRTFHYDTLYSTRLLFNFVAENYQDRGLRQR